MSPEEDEILRRRARALAKRDAGAAAGGDRVEVLEFRLADERYCVATARVTGVYPLKELAPLPCTPPFVLGIVNVRGRVTPVVDIKKFFGLPEEGLTDLHCIVLVRGQGVELGLLADMVVSVQSMPAASFQSTLPTLTGIHSEYLKGVTAERLVMLDLDRILGDPRIMVHEEVEG